MNRILDKLKNHPGILLIAVALLLPFALLLNIGLMPLISDEPTRAIVTLEMILSGNYITPTINGEFYYNKPPLFNWILAGFVQISGKQDEFIFRLPTIISLVLSAFSIFLFSRKALGKYDAVIAALMLVTSARILFWDSFQGLIDVTYALITFGSFAALYHFSEGKKYLLMFLFTYTMAAAGYLMKGLPSVAFQGISLLAWMMHEKSFRKLFTFQHLAGIAVFLLITGTYYYAYLQTNSLQDVFSTLLDQSNRINDKDGTPLSWSSHLFVFPFEMAYEFAPWTLLLLLLFDRDVRRRTFEQKFFRYCLLIFLSNIIIYWVSADMRPRYLFMLFPLLFIILTKAWREALRLQTRMSGFIGLLFLLMIVAALLSLLIYPFWKETMHLPGIATIIPVLFIVTGFSVFAAVKLPQFRIWFLVIALLSVRIGFNAFNLPARYNSYPDAGYRQGEVTTGRLSRGHDLFILGDTPFNHDASFYISRERGSIVRRTWEISDKRTCYITDEKNLANFADKLRKYEVLHKFSIKLNESRLYLIRR